jgi:hypothetical protein
MNTLRQLHQMVYRYPPYETVINWLNTLDIKVLQFILSKYTYSVYRKHSKEMCIDALSVFISDKYREEERRMIISLESVFSRYGDMLVWAQGNENIPQLYRQYCGQFMEDETNLPPTEEECQILVSSIQNRNISPTISYYTAKRFNNFIMYKYSEYRRDHRRTTSNNTIKYVLTRKNIAIPIQIECPICMETKETPNIITTTCDHQFCKDCINSLLSKKTIKRCNCPLCRTPIHKIIQETLQP